ncbi:MAG: NuoF family protein [Deinococcota bacterium]
MREREAQGNARCRVMCCNSTACLSSGAAATREALDKAVEDNGLADSVQVVPTGCMGWCSEGPLVRMKPAGEETTLYAQVDAQQATDIIQHHLTDAGDQSDKQPTPDVKTLSEDHPFFSRQQRIVLANMGEIDPERLEDYVAHGGYTALEKVLQTMQPADVVQEILASGLRGRGGGGYPTGKKWAMLHAAQADTKYVIANGDEGDPGAYMDRTIMEDDPNNVIEGMTIAAYATGASKGYIYVRAEYPMAVQRLENAIRIAKRNRLLGRSVLGSNFAFDIEVRIGAGAFVCGEETALMASIEGKRGSPMLRPPYPVERGLWGKPSMINNVESYANVAAIIRHGADWFSSIGTENSKGTKVFALAGELNNTGLIEVPMGISLREIIEDMGDGVAGKHDFKAAQTGGPSGGCIPAAHLDTSMDYESLQALGSIMGSGGLIVMNETSSMPEVAKFFMEFCMDESCGKCLPCRAGTVQMHQLLEKICEGKARPSDLVQLESLCEMVAATSLCGLGQSAPNPIVSTLRYFRSEYEDLLMGTSARAVWAASASQQDMGEGAR